MCFGILFMAVNEKNLNSEIETDEYASASMFSQNAVNEKNLNSEIETKFKYINAERARTCKRKESQFWDWNIGFRCDW